MKPTDIKWTKQARKDIKKLDRVTNERIREAVENLVTRSEGDVRRLEGQEDMYRLRIGDWRVRFTVDDQGRIVVMVILRVLPRGSSYSKRNL